MDAASGLCSRNPPSPTITQKHSHEPSLCCGALPRHTYLVYEESIRYTNLIHVKALLRRDRTDTARFVGACIAGCAMARAACAGRRAIGIARRSINSRTASTVRNSATRCLQANKRQPHREIIKRCHIVRRGEGNVLCRMEVGRLHHHLEIAIFVHQAVDHRNNLRRVCDRKRPHFAAACICI